MHPCVHVTTTALIVATHIFQIAVDVRDKIHFVMAYTILDTFFIFSNIRRNSLLIHHFVTLYVLMSCRMDDSLVDVLKPLVALEVTTFFNSLNQCLRNPLTRTLRNVSWVSIRMVYLPIVSFRMIDQLSGMNHVNEAYCVATLLILSYEWSFELLKIRFPFFPLVYYYVGSWDIIFVEGNLSNIDTILSIMRYVLIITPIISTQIVSYENRMLAHLGSALLMRRAY